MMKLTYSSLCFVVFFAAGAEAGDWCRHAKQLSADLDLRGVDRIEVLAVSGDLSITGASRQDRVSATGRACVSYEYRDRLDEIAIVEEREGSLLRIIAKVPFRSDKEDWRIGGLDLDLKVPDSLPLVVSDSSGDLKIDNVRSLELTDSSGDIRLSNIYGPTLIDRDSSGDIDIRDAGDITIRIDSSGDIDVRRARSLSIGTDSSGSIVAREIQGDVVVDTDTSGDVRVSDIGGDFTVGRDTSGDVRHERVAGRVRIFGD